jgi:hypothetical protein
VVFVQDEVVPEQLKAVLPIAPVQLLPT